MKNPVFAAIDKKLQKYDPIWRAENGMGGQRDRYYDKTGIEKYREWRGCSDTLFDYWYWLKNLGSLGMMAASAPIPVVKGMLEYRWMCSFLGTFNFANRLFEGFRGPELRVADMHMHAIVACLAGKIGDSLANDRRLGGGPKTDKMVSMDETIPPLFMGGFPNLTPIPIQTFPEFVICDIDQKLEPYYIDIAESYGLPADVCSRCSAETGVTINDDFPDFGKGILSTNQPCNASEATSMFQRRRFASKGVEDHVFAFSMIHNEEGGHVYSAAELRATIKFLEETYDEKYDWDALFAAAKEMNAQNQMEIEKWEILKTPYSALCGIAETLYKLFEWASANGLDPRFTKVDRKVMKILYKQYERKYQPFGGKTRHRAFLWGPSAVYYTDFPTWCQNCWGLAIVLNMDSTMGHNMIDTQDPEQALIDLAKFSEKGVMRHHAVGGWDNVNAVWDWAKKMNCDMVMVNDNVSCKGMNGVHALLEEQAHDLGFHFMFVEHDLEDCRTISRRDMRKQVSNYMSVVLGEKPLDETLVDFDDSEAW